MKKKNLIVGVAAGAALLSVALLLAKKNKYNWKSVCESAEDAIDSIRQKMGKSSNDTQSDNQNDHGGKHLANKARHKAEHHLAMSKNGHS